VNVTGTPSDEPAFLGAGWAFPPTFLDHGADVAMTEGSVNVAQSIAILVRTQHGERVMRPGFGAGLDAVMFAEVDQDLLNSVTSLITDAVLYHEPRVRLDDVDVTQTVSDPGLLRIAVTYTVLANNSRYNLVYPFVLTEAQTGAGAP
jgi:Bacteriophage baseplate protein W